MVIAAKGLSSREQELCKRTFVHYGQERYMPEWFSEIKNRNGSWNKPRGGLWCSFERSPRNWARWCKAENFHVDDLNISFKVKIKLGARIFSISNVSDLKYIPIKEGYESRPSYSYNIAPDFEELAKHYDGIIFDLSSDPRLYDHLYGWDVDSLLIMNPDMFLYDEEVE